MFAKQRTGKHEVSLLKNEKKIGGQSSMFNSVDMKRKILPRVERSPCVGTRSSISQDCSFVEYRA